MNKSIAGSGEILAGEYESIRISGSGRLFGLVRCESFSTSGSSTGESIECGNAFKVSGESTFTKDVSAGHVSIAGSFTCGGDLLARERVSVSGSAKCMRNIKCGSMSVAGELIANADIEAETVKVTGEVKCAGLLNAESITIKGNGSKIGSVGGSSIVICRGSVSKNLVKVPVISTIVKSVSSKVCVMHDIEGDEIMLENVEVPRVSGRIVTIGDDCRIDLVQYSQEINISPKAKVAKTEKI
ncbi:MAG: polymer-forming cytoskeletal protein [Ruminococcaceae bacterium]|nr:polymer-forming cytoskeletal protein [Oscillospiraceae bacterium]